MKTRLNSLNRTANAAKISGGGSSHARCGNLVFNPDGHPTVNRQSTIASLSSHYSQYALILTTTLLLLFTLSIGNAWGWDWKNNKTVYFDNQNCPDFSTPYVRIGNNSDWSNAYPMTLVAGTKYLYSYKKTDGDWTGAHRFSIANNTGWTGNDSYKDINHAIIQPTESQSKDNDNWVNNACRIVKQTSYQSYNIDADCYIKIDAGDNVINTEYGCTYYKVNNATTDGPILSLPTYSVTYNTPANGTLTVTKYNGSTYDATSSGDNDYKPTQIIKITTTPNPHYALASLSVSGATQIDAGDTYYITGDCEISASFAPVWAIKGSDSFAEDDDNDEMGDWKVYNGLEYTGTEYHYSAKISLAAHTAYYFKIVDRGNSDTYYGCGTRNNDYTYVGQTDEVAISTSPGNNVLLLTTQAGEYTFNWNSSAHTLQILYPTTISHPSMDYVYMEKYADWNSGTHCYVHYFYDDGGDGETMTTWGSDNPKFTAYTTIGGTNYYCIPILTAYPNFIAKNNLGAITDEHGTLEMYTAGHSGHCAYWKDNTEKWTWKGLSVRIQLNDLSATTHVEPNYMDVAFNSAVLTDLTTVPVKTNYDFGGFYTDYNDETEEVSGTQVIDASGQWIASVPDYTDASKHWIHAGTSTTLYAKWTETPRTIMLYVSPDGAGSISPSGSTTAYIVTPSATITATPSHAAWRFKEWQYGTGVGNKDETGNDNTVQVTADRDGTLTAVFEPRFALVGSSTEDENPTKGMPGWDNYTTTGDFVVNNTDPVDLTITCSLQANTTYKFQVHDRAEQKNYGIGTDGLYLLLDGASAELTVPNMDVRFEAIGAGDYTFKITALNGDNSPTITILRPHQVNFGRRRVDIDGGVHDDDTGGTLVVKSGETTLSSGDWVNYGENVKYDAATGLVSGYTQTWYKSDSYAEAFTAGGIWNHALTSHDNVYAQFTENATTVTISANNTRGGSITVGGSAFTWGSTKTAGVTTKRALVVTPNTGYNFTGWTLSSTPDFELQAEAPETDTEVTLAGLGNGSSGTLTANFTAKTYSVTLNDDQDGEHNGSATATYHTTALSVSTHADVTGWMRLGYWNTSGIKVTDADGSLIANVENYTNPSGEWIYDGDVTLYAHWYRKVTLDKNGGTEDGQIGVDYKGIGSSLELPTRSGYSVEGFYAEAGCTTKVMNPNGSLLKNVSGYTDSNGKWISKTVDKLYAKWIFIIYRTGDKAGDPRAQSTDVESYAGGTISEAIEYRMKVHTLNQWTTLCLPFVVNAVQVWDPADGPDYYDIVPYYRADGKFYNGHYIIRTPKTATDLAIAEFDQWNDPESSSYKPFKNTPYIIQWHDGYFLGKYISFFGVAGQEIYTSMRVGAAPSSDNVVNVYGNDAMVSGTVSDAYLLVPDYGSSGAWLREDIGTNRTINPFECYIRANSATTTRYRILRRGAIPDDTPTGWDDVINAEPKTDIMVYTITGFPVARYYDCSFTEAAQRLHSEQGEGIYILRSANESVKLMVGGK